MTNNFMDNNRNIFFLGITMIVGVLLIGGLFLVDGGAVSDDVNTDPVSKEFYKILENKIEGIKSKKFEANDFNTLSAEINAYYNQKLITSTSKTYLDKKLITIYSDMIYGKSEIYLKSGVGNIADIIKLLNHIQQLNSSSSKTNFYKTQIKWSNYYASTLPAQVNQFISPGISNYEDTEYVRLKTQVENMPYLNSIYKNSVKFTRIRQNLLQNLKQFNYEFYSN